MSKGQPLELHTPTHVSELILFALQLPIGLSLKPIYVKKNWPIMTGTQSTKINFYSWK